MRDKPAMSGFVPATSLREAALPRLWVNHVAATRALSPEFVMSGIVAGVDRRSGASCRAGSLIDCSGAVPHLPAGKTFPAINKLESA